LEPVIKKSKPVLSLVEVVVALLVEAVKINYFMQIDKERKKYIIICCLLEQK
jgi:hypothetical protein